MNSNVSKEQLIDTMEWCQENLKVISEIEKGEFGLVKLDAIPIKNTEKAVLFYDNQSEFWVPVSLLNLDSDGCYYIPDWKYSQLYGE